MGKRKEHEQALSTDNFPVQQSSHEDSPSSSHKKHKKHKKKHKRNRDESAGVSSNNSSPFKSSIKLKLKIGGETFATKDVTPVDNSQKIVDTDEDAIVNVIDEPWDDGVEPKFPVKAKDADTSDEEREWLEALEKGTLDDYGEAQKKRDPSLMTVRQRAMLEGRQEKLQALPSGYKIVKLTEEQLIKRQQRAKKRKEQAQEKVEKDKKQTVDRLLKKQEIKQKGPKFKLTKRMAIPRIHYSNRANRITISCPVGYSFPFRPQKRQELPKQPLSCAVEGCKNKKKYSCSKTGVPLCSLECYKKNHVIHGLQQAVA